MFVCVGILNNNMYHAAHKPKFSCCEYLLLTIRKGVSYCAVQYGIYEASFHRIIWMIQK